MLQQAKKCIPIFNQKIKGARYTWINTVIAILQNKGKIYEFTDKQKETIKDVTILIV